MELQSRSFHLIPLCYLKAIDQPIYYVINVLKFEIKIWKGRVLLTRATPKRRLDLSAKKAEYVADTIYFCTKRLKTSV